MKKIAKNAVLVLIIASLLVLLTGCGSNKLVATRETSDESIGTYKETVTVKFKNDKVSSMEMVMEFDNDEAAESVYSIYSLALSMSKEEGDPGMEIKKDNKKLIITLDAKSFLGEDTPDEKLTKDAMKAELEEMGYKVK